MIDETDDTDDDLSDLEFARIRSQPTPVFRRLPSSRNFPQCEKKQAQAYPVKLVTVKVRPPVHFLADRLADEAHSNEVPTADLLAGKAADLLAPGSDDNFGRLRVDEPRSSNAWTVLVAGSAYTKPEVPLVRAVLQEVDQAYQNEPALLVDIIRPMLPTDPLGCKSRGLATPNAGVATGWAVDQDVLWFDGKLYLP